MKDEIKGKADELKGKLTGDRSEELKGKAEQAMDKAKRTGRDIRVLPQSVLYDPEMTLTLPPGMSGWLRMDAGARIERLSRLPVTHVVAGEADGAGARRETT